MAAVRHTHSWSTSCASTPRTLRTKTTAPLMSSRWQCRKIHTCWTAILPRAKKHHPLLKHSPLQTHQSRTDSQESIVEDSDWPEHCNVTTGGLLRERIFDCGRPHDKDSDEISDWWRRSVRIIRWCGATCLAFGAVAKSHGLKIAMHV